MTTKNASNYLNRRKRLRKYDAFGRTFTFFLGQKKTKKYKTVVGGLLTLLSWLLSALALIIFTKKFLDRSQAEVSVNTQNQSRDHFYNTHKNEIFLLFTLFNGVEFPKTEKTLKYWTLNAQRETTFFAENDQKDRRTLIDRIPLVKCEHMDKNITDNTKTAMDSTKY